MKSLFILCLTIAAASAFRSSFWDFMGQRDLSPRTLGHQQPLIVVVAKDSKDMMRRDRFVGKFIHDPSVHFETNYLNLLLALNFSAELVNKMCSIEIHRISGVKFGELRDDLMDADNQYRLIVRFESDLVPLPITDIIFELGKRGIGTSLGRPVEHVVAFIGDKMTVALNYPDLGLIRLIFDFNDDFSALVETVILPNGLIGKKEMVRIDKIKGDKFLKKLTKRDEDQREMDMRMDFNPMMQQ